MKIVKLKNVVPEYLLSAQYDGEEMDEFERLLSDWTDPEFLRNFFKKNEERLLNGFYDGINSIDKAVLLTIDEAEQFANRLLESDCDGELVLDEIFKPLHAGSTSIVREESKAYGPRRKSWLRFYAIRITNNYYAISGGGIKLTRTMQEIEGYQEELKKLKVLADFLKINGVECQEDYSYLDIEFL